MPNNGEPQLSDILKQMLETGEMVGPLEMANGDNFASMTVATSFPTQTNEDSGYWAFIVPDGYIRYSGTFETSHHAGDSAHCDWANGNPKDGTVHASVYASQTNGYARAAASNLYAVKPESLDKLYKKVSDGS